MKVYIGPYVKWFGPYQLAERILFWKDKYKGDSVHALGERLESIAPLKNFLNWLYNKKQRKVKVHIDHYDVWSADHTLAMIIHPVLVKLKENKHGSPSVDDEDVPEHLRSTAAPELTEEQKNCGAIDENWHKRWEWVLDEMIWAFGQHAADDWEDQFYSGDVDVKFVKVDGTDLSRMEHGPNHTFKVDTEQKLVYMERMDNGRRLFAKYYKSLWD